jgi:hypothetical protein
MLPLRQYDFGETRAQRAMVVHLGKSDIFKGQVPQARHGLVRRQLAAPDLFE